METEEVVEMEALALHASHPPIQETPRRQLIEAIAGGARRRFAALCEHVRMEWTNEEYKFDYTIVTSRLRDEKIRDILREQGLHIPVFLIPFLGCAPDEVVVDGRVAMLDEETLLIQALYPSLPKKVRCFVPPALIHHLTIIAIRKLGAEHGVTLKISVAH